MFGLPDRFAPRFHTSGFILVFLERLGFSGITLPPFGIWVNRKYDSYRLRAHELVHWAQYGELGAIRFYLKYLWLFLRYGYARHPMEKVARDLQNDPTFIREARRSFQWPWVQNT